MRFSGLEATLDVSAFGYLNRTRGDRRAGVLGAQRDYAAGVARGAVVAQRMA